MSKDVLFINPGGYKKTYQDLSKEFTAIDTPVWPALLSNLLRNSGYTVAVYDANVEGWNEESVKQVISSYDPELIILMVYGNHPSASTQTMPAAGRIAKFIKSYNNSIPIALGGTHPSALPEKTLDEEDVDYIIQGLGVCTVTGLIKCIKGRESIDAVPGLWYKKEGRTGNTPLSPCSENPDQLMDDYAWDLLPEISNYRAHNWHCFQYFKNSKSGDFTDVRAPYVSLYTSLGCPFSCDYCCINALYGKPSLQYWSVGKVVS